MKSPPPPNPNWNGHARIGRRPAPNREESPTLEPWVPPHLVRIEESPALHTQWGGGR